MAATGLADTDTQRVAVEGASPVAGRLLTWLRHILCVAALMWTGILNGQPFFFPDTTNYVRAADAAVYVISGHRFSTEWTARYRDGIDNPGKQAVQPPKPEFRPSSNDVGHGLIMGGRSVYIGFLMYLGWVFGRFWPFVIFQAATAYILINLTLRRFQLGSAANVTGVTLILAALTALPTYNSLLLADAFASFGIVAFLLLIDRVQRHWATTAFLVAVLLISVTAHMTHLMMLIGMVVVAAVIALVRRQGVPRRPLIIGIAGILVAVAALQATNVATQMAFGRAPQLLPLLTARFYIDGPGKRYVEHDCNGRFQVCRMKLGKPADNTEWLFSGIPQSAAYMLGDIDQRRRMGEEDVAFALAVLRTYPAEQIGMAASNTLRQLAWVDYGGLNQGCFAKPECWTSLPPSVRDELRQSMSGRNAWPDRAMNVVLQILTLASLAAIAIGLRLLYRRDPDYAATVTDWLLIGGTAMAVCCFFGGAVADPQYRYQGRLIWLIVLMAAIILLRLRALSTGQGRQA